MQPTKDRNHNGIFVDLGEEGLLVDCGEGIQRQLKIAGIRPTKITRIMITHWHGDHMLGLPGLLQTMAANEYQEKLTIYGPKGSERYMKAMLSLFMYAAEVEILVKEVSHGDIFETKNYTVSCAPLEHSVPCIGYAVQEKDRYKINVEYLRKNKIPDGPHLADLQEGRDGSYKGKKIKLSEATTIVRGKRIAFVFDSRPCQGALELAANADLFVCEGVFTRALAEKAEEKKHMTAYEASMLAQQAQAKKLLLSHFSQRYKTTQEILEDATEVFPNTVCAYDFMKVKV